MNETSKTLPDEHQYAHLTHGKCHYRIDGPKSGKVILLIHGATVAGWIFEQFRPYLIAANYRTITVDLFGHGYSQRLDVQYNLNLYQSQMSELLQNLGLLEKNKPISLIGHSLGAAVATALANQNPQQFDRIVLTAPLIDFMANMPIVKLFAFPIIGECLNRLYIIPMLKRRRRKRYAPIADGRFIEKFLSQFLIPGFDKTVLSLFRSGILSDKTDLYQRFAATGIPSLVVFGEQDELVTNQQIAHLKQLMPDSKSLGLEGAGHAFILNEPERISKKLIQFLNDEPTIS